MSVAQLSAQAQEDREALKDAEARQPGQRAREARLAESERLLAGSLRLLPLGEQSGFCLDEGTLVPSRAAQADLVTMLFRQGPVIVFVLKGKESDLWPWVSHLMAQSGQVDMPVVRKLLQDHQAK